jgi:dethiobiotin synthase
MSLAILGTDTNVGKTVASAALLARYVDLPLAYWKPIATGSIEGRDTEEVTRLAPPSVEVLPEQYLFREPLSPHLAAEREGRTIDFERLVARGKGLLARADRHFVVEGAGGALVPLGPLTRGGPLLVDLFAALDLPCLVIARSTLGTINHTLLTLEALRARGLVVAGVLMVGPPNEENRRAIETLGGVEVLGELPPLQPLTRETLQAAAAHLDLAGALSRHLGQEKGATHEILP